MEMTASMIVRGHLVPLLALAVMLMLGLPLHRSPTTPARAAVAADTRAPQWASNEPYRRTLQARLGALEQAVFRMGALARAGAYDSQVRASFDWQAELSDVITTLHRNGGSLHNPARVPPELRSLTGQLAIVGAEADDVSSELQQWQETGSLPSLARATNQAFRMVGHIHAVTAALNT